MAWRTRGWLVAAALLLSAGSAVRAEIPEPLALEWALERARATSPDVAAREAERDAARARVAPAGAWEDPRVSYEASNLPIGDLGFGSTPLSGHQLGLRQKLPFPGLLRSRRSAALAARAAAESGVADERISVAGRVEQAWAELGFQQRALAITRRNIDLMRQLASVAEARYRVGKGLQQDVLRARVELTRFLEEELARQAAGAAAGARLAALLDLDPDLSLPFTAALDDAAPVPEVEPLLDGLESRSPQLAALAARRREAEERVRVAELEGLPDVELGVGYRVRRNVRGDPVRGDDFLGAGVTVRLPIDRRRWSAHTAEARARLRRIRAEYRGALADLRARLRSAHAELVRADADSVLVATGLLPQAEQSLRSSRSAYEVGRIDFLALLDSQLNLLRAELRQVRALADRRIAFAALEIAAGESLR